jgi:hypothetical protein
MMADRAEVAGLTLPRPPAIATKTRTIFGCHFGDRNALAKVVTKAKELWPPTKKTTGKNQKKNNTKMWGVEFKKKKKLKRKTMKKWIEKVVSTSSPPIKSV